MDIPFWGQKTFGCWLLVRISVSICFADLLPLTKCWRNSFTSIMKKSKKTEENPSPMTCARLQCKHRLHATRALSAHRGWQVCLNGCAEFRPNSTQSTAPPSASNLLRDFIWQCFPLPTPSFTSSKCKWKQEALHQINLTQPKRNAGRPWELLVGAWSSAQVFKAVSFSSLSALFIRFLSINWSLAARTLKLAWGFCLCLILTTQICEPTEATFIRN